MPYSDELRQPSLSYPKKPTQRRFASTHVTEQKQRELKAKADEFKQQIAQSTADEAGVVESFAAGWIQSSNDLLRSTIGTGSKMVGTALGSQGMKDFGEAATQYFDENAKNYLWQLPESAQSTNDLTKDMTNANWWAAQLGGSVPSFAITIAGAGLAAKAASLVRFAPKAINFIKASGWTDEALQALGTAAKQSTPETLSALGKATGIGEKALARSVGRLTSKEITAVAAITGGAMGGFIEGAGTYEKAKQLGMSDMEALEASAKMGLGSGALNATSFGFILGKLPTGVKGYLLHKMVTGGVEAVTEALEEPTELLSLKGFEGLRDKQGLYQTLQNGIRVAGPAFVMGAIAGGGAERLKGGKYPEKAKEVAGPSPEIDPEKVKADAYAKSREVLKSVGLKDADIVQLYGADKAREKTREDLEAGVQAALEHKKYINEQGRKSTPTQRKQAELEIAKARLELNMHKAASGEEIKEEPLDLEAIGLSKEQLTKKDLSEASRPVSLDEAKEHLSSLETFYEFSKKSGAPKQHMTQLEKRIKLAKIEVANFDPSQVAELITTPSDMERAGISPKDIVKQKMGEPSKPRTVEEAEGTLDSILNFYQEAKDSNATNNLLSELRNKAEVANVELGTFDPKRMRELVWDDEEDGGGDTGVINGEEVEFAGERTIPTTTALLDEIFANPDEVLQSGKGSTTEERPDMVGDTSATTPSTPSQRVTLPTGSTQPVKVTGAGDKEYNFPSTVGIQEIPGTTSSGEDVVAKIPAKNEPMLPQGLKGAKPRYKDATLAFESDVDRAIYIAGNRDVKSRADSSYMQWLQKHGVDSATVSQRHAEIKEQLKTAEPENGTITVSKSQQPLFQARSEAAGSMKEQLDLAVEDFSATSGVKVHKNIIKSVLNGTTTIQEAAAKMLQKAGVVNYDVEDGRLVLNPLVYDEEGEVKPFGAAKADDIATVAISFNALVKGMSRGYASVITKGLIPGASNLTELEEMPSAMFDTRFQQAREQGWVKKFVDTTNQAMKQGKLPVTKEQVDSLSRLLFARGEAWAAMEKGRTSEQWFNERFHDGGVQFDEKMRGVDGKMPTEVAKSRLDAAIDKIVPTNAARLTPQGWAIKLKTHDVAEEIQSSGLMDWMNQKKGTVTKREVMDFLRDGRNQRQVLSGMVQKTEEMRNLITLARTADFSTIFHELGHVFREDLEGTDLETVINWTKRKLGPNSVVKNEGGMGYTFSVEAEELWAKGWEEFTAFTKQGEVPQNVKGVFGKFRNWLGAIYKHYFRKSDLKLPTEVRQIMANLFMVPMKTTADNKMLEVNIATRSGRTRINPGYLSVDSAMQEFWGRYNVIAQNEKGKRHTDDEMLQEVVAMLDEPNKHMERIQGIIAQGGILGDTDKRFISMMMVNKAKSFMEKFDKAPNAEAKEALVRAVRNGDPIFTLAEYDRSESGAALRSLQLQTSLQQMMALFSSANRQLSVRERNVLYQALADVHQLKPGAVERFQDLTDSMHNSPQLRDVVSQLLYNGVLSDPTTHFLNALTGLTYNVWLAGPHRAIAAGVDTVVSKLTGKQREIYFSEIGPALFKNARERANKAFSAATYIIKTGKHQEGTFEQNALKTDITNRQMLALENLPDMIDLSKFGAGSKDWGGYLRKIAPFVTMPSRLLRAADVFIQMYMLEGHINSMAIREANKLHQEGKITEEEIDGKVAEFNRTPTDAMMKEAGKIAALGTFADAPGKVTQRVISTKSALADVPIIGPLAVINTIPFVNTLVNITKRGLEMVPGLGLGVEYLNYQNRKEDGSSDMYLPKGVEIAAKQIEGALLTFALMSMFDSDDDDGYPRMTAGMPENPREKETWTNLGILPYSVRVGGQYMQFAKIAPINYPLSLVAGLVDATRKYNSALLNPEEEASLTKEFGKAAEGFMYFVVNSSPLSSLSRSLDPHDAAQNIAASSATALVPYSGLMRTVSKAIDLVQSEHGVVVKRDVPVALSSFTRVLPFAAGSLPAKLNVWGEPVTLKAEGIFRSWLPVRVSSTSNDPVEVELMNLDHQPSIPYPDKLATIHKGQVVQIPDDMYTQFAVSYGTKAKAKVAQVIQRPHYQRLDATTYEGKVKRKNMIEQAMRDVRTVEENRLKNKLREQVREGKLQVGRV